MLYLILFSVAASSTTFSVHISAPFCLDVLVFYRLDIVKYTHFNILLYSYLLCSIIVLILDFRIKNFRVSFSETLYRFIASVWWSQKIHRKPLNDVIITCPQQISDNKVHRDEKREEKKTPGIISLVALHFLMHVHFHVSIIVFASHFNMNAKQCEPFLI